MSRNTETVARYMKAYGRWDHAAILGCLAEDVEWMVPGAFHLRGKQAFDAEIEGVGAKGPPTAVMDRMLEAGDVVVAEGFVRNETVDGPAIELAMCDVFELRDGLVTKLTSYLMPAPFPGDSYPRVGGEAPALL